MPDGADQKKKTPPAPKVDKAETAMETDFTPERAPRKILRLAFVAAILAVAALGLAIDIDPDSPFLYPAAQVAKSAPLGRAGLIEILFGDRMDDYVAGEKRRWELTLSHWDTDFIQLDKSEKPLSVYMPSPGGCEK